MYSVTRDHAVAVVIVVVMLCVIYNIKPYLFSVVHAAVGDLGDVCITPNNTCTDNANHVCDNDGYCSTYLCSRPYKLMSDVVDIAPSQFDVKHPRV